MQTLILYFTTDGQTKKIADKLAEQISHEVEVISLQDQAVNFAEKLANADQIVIGASIRYGHFNPLMYKFVAEHQVVLNQKKSAFFSVNLTARKLNRRTAETNVYVIAGALLYPRYKFFDRMMIQFIMKLTKGETDASKEYEFTDWAQVEQFGKLLDLGLK